jgi:hypothetical protein
MAEIAEISDAELRQIIAEGIEDWTRAYFKWTLGKIEREQREERSEHKLSLAESTHIAQVLRMEAKRRGVDLREPTLPATARARKAAKTETGPKAAPQVKRSTCSPAK